MASNNHATPSEAETVHAYLISAAAESRGEQLGFNLDLTALLCACRPEVVDLVAEQLILEQVAAQWARGWQPAELVRQGRLGCHSSPAARLAALAIAVDHAGRRSVTLHHRWAAQVESLELLQVRADLGLVAQWSREERLDRTEVVAAYADVLGNLLYLPRLDTLLPPPGTGDVAPPATWYADLQGAGRESDPLLGRIRNLLAKAESTTFEAEALAFTAKAQELMTRHAIDAALVQSGAPNRHEQPGALRLPLDAPYVEAKAQLLNTVADACRCRAVLHVSLALCTVVGFSSDLASVELLFTSLLVQAQTAMDDAARVAQAGTRARTKAFRSAFLVAYTSRIGERLREINSAVYAAVEAEQGAGFLPVLRSRSEAVDSFIAERFGDLLSRKGRRTFDAAGWASGRAAADTARLNAAHLDTGADVRGAP
jgi:hypothetical protein